MAFYLFSQSLLDFVLDLGDGFNERAAHDELVDESFDPLPLKFEVQLLLHDLVDEGSLLLDPLNDLSHTNFGDTVLFGQIGVLHVLNECPASYF